MEPTRHLLDNLYPNNHLLLLEAMLPFVEPSMQLPLALFIKFQEVQFIMQAFRNPEKLSACGFQPASMGNEDLLQVLGQTMGVDLNARMQSMTSFQNNSSPNNSDTKQGFPYSDLMDTDHFQKAPADTYSDDFSHSRDDMMEAIREILRERPESD